MSLVSNYGMRRTMDAASRFYRIGLPCYMRVTLPQADQSSQPFAQLGFQVSASGGLVTNDILIDPPPQVQSVSLRDIGLNAAELSLGDQHFLISQTWVRQQQVLNNWIDASGNPDYYRVFRDPLVIGFFYNARIWKITSFTYEALGGLPWTWDCIGSATIQPSVG